MQVSELVPEIAFLEGFGVGDLEMLPARGGEGAHRPASGERLEHREMGRTRFVQSCQHRVDGPYAALRRYKDVGPAFPRMGRTVPVRDRLERPHDGSSDGDHPASRSARRVDRLRGLSRDPVELLVGRLVVFEAGYARVKYQRYDPDPVRDEACDQLRGESPSRRRHLGAAYLRGVDALVVANRPTLPDVAVPDG